MSQYQKLQNGSSTPEIETLTGDAGGAVSSDAALNVNIVGGTGINVVGNPGTNTLTINTTGGFLTWSRVAGPAVAMDVDNGYIPTNAALVTFTLPVTAAVGDEIMICGEGLGGFTISQNAGQTIRFGNVASTTGVGGSVSSTNQWDTVSLVCRVADTDWSVMNNVGILNVV